MSATTILTCNNCSNEVRNNGEFNSGWADITLNITFADENTKNKISSFRKIFQTDYPNIHLCPECMVDKSNWNAGDLLKSWLSKPRIVK